MDTTNDTQGQGAAVAREAILDALESQEAAPAVEVFRLAHQKNAALDYEQLQRALLSLLQDSCVSADARLRLRRMQLAR